MNYLISVAGNIGSGKTTLTRKIAGELGWKSFFESVIDNPYLHVFYADMKRWSFHLQIYFLSHRFRSQRLIMDAGINAVQDRTIYEDVEIFARSLYEKGYMTKRDYQTYRELFENMIEYLRPPDLIIYLKSSVDTLVQRIRQRNRDFEKNISPEYLDYLNHSYNRWIRKAQKNFKIITLNTDEVDILKERDKFEQLVKKIRETCP